MNAVEKELVQTLLSKAEIDLLNATILRDSSQGNPEGIGFHVQQAVEKSLKAILVFHGIDYPRTHSIVGLARLASDNDIDLPDAFPESDRYTDYAVEFRYDQLGPDEEFNFDEAVTHATECVTFAKSLLEDALS
jgi:HEPN domain-containing protein